MATNVSKNTATNGTGLAKSSHSQTWGQATRAWDSSAASVSPWNAIMAQPTNISKNTATNGTNVTKS